MMEKLRTAANSLIIKIIFGLIIVAFIFTGFGSFLDFGPNIENDKQLYIAKINGEGISRAAYEKELQMALKNSKNLSENDPLIKELSQSIISNLINDVLSYELADSLDLNISDEQVKNQIRQQDIFFVNGAFNQERYLNILALANYTPDAYANGLRSAMKKNQLLDALISTNFVVPKDSDISALFNQTRTVYLSNYGLSNVEGDFSVSDEEIKEYYNQNKQSFNHPTRLKMEYLINPYPEIKNKVMISNSMVEQYYADSKSGTMSLAKQSFSILSFNSLAKANAEYKKLMAMKTKNRLNVKMDDLGWFNKDDQIVSLLGNQKLTAVGSISKPINQSGRYYIVRLDKIKEAQKLPLNYVRGNIIELLKTEEANKIYNEQQIRLEKAAKLPTIDEISKASGLPVIQSKWTTENELYSIGRFPTIHDIIFSDLMIKDGKPTNTISDIIYAPEYQSSFIIQVTDYQEPGIKDLEEVKDDIKDFLIAKKKKENFAIDVENIIAKMNKEQSAGNVQFVQRATFSRNNNSNKLLNQDTIDKIFSVVPDPKTGEVFGGTIENDINAKLFVLTSIKDGQITDISNQLQLDYMGFNYDYIIDDLRSHAKIEMMDDN